MTRVLCWRDVIDLLVVATVCDDVIGVAGACSESVSTSERVDDDVLQTSFDVVLELHDRPPTLRLTLTHTHSASTRLVDVCGPLHRKQHY